ncbi:hypothetical protein HDU86_001483 [Geranomyces michiganensis]|nr:hypothetical protein HDU86_001483 [Geranomyces michiganensis]
MSAADSSSKAAHVQNQVNEVTAIMQDNINKVMQRGEHLDTLQDKTDDLQNSSLQFKRGANRVRKQMWWKDMKMKLILGSVIAAILIIVIVVIVQQTNFTNDISHYELISDIGGVDDISYLYLAKHVPTGEFVALKYTDLTLSPDYELIDELIRTVRNTKLCQHRNILPYWTTFVETERMWNVTYPMKIGSFRSIMQKHYPDGLSEVIVATTLREVLNAILYMHENRMIHNDIRADNILLGDHGEIRVTGLRQMISLSQGGQFVESVFSIVGDNIEWAAPEVIAQNSNYDEKADIYSLGITALELAFNKTPFDDWPPLKVLLSKLEFPCPAIPTEQVLSRDFYRLVNACIQKDPSVRPSARELLEHPFIKLARSTRYLEAHLVHGISSPKSSRPSSSLGGATTPEPPLSSGDGPE